MIASLKPGSSRASAGFWLIAAAAIAAAATSADVASEQQTIVQFDALTPSNAVQAGCGLDENS